MANVPNIVTSIPGPKSQKMINQRNEYVPAGVYLVQPVTIAESKGAIVKDIDSNTLLDFTSARAHA
jgi:4-aminobutyrate aminotransferase/(S)-3-amino-2-methylpropionate transaminase